jgi:hypothetical protein
MRRSSITIANHAKRAAVTGASRVPVRGLPRAGAVSPLPYSPTNLPPNA